MPPFYPPRLEDLPNIGKSIAADLRAIGITTPQQLAGRDPLATYRQLGGPMGRRHDPCVLYVLLAAERQSLQPQRNRNVRGKKP